MSTEFSYAQVNVWISSEDGKAALSKGAPLELKKAKSPRKRDIIVDPAQTYQSIVGLGGSLEHSTCYNLSRLTPEKREEVIERLVSPAKGIGMNLMRICIGTSDFAGEPYYSYDDVPEGQADPALDHFSIEKDRAYVLPVLKTALAKNPELLFVASPWSPPAWMKTNDSLAEGELKPEWYGAYMFTASATPRSVVTFQWKEPGRVEQ